MRENKEESEEYARVDDTARILGYMIIWIIIIAVVAFFAACLITLEICNSYVMQAKGYFVAYMWLKVIFYVFMFELATYKYKNGTNKSYSNATVIIFWISDFFATLISFSFYIEDIPAETLNNLSHDVALLSLLLIAIKIWITYRYIAEVRN